MRDMFGIAADGGDTWNASQDPRIKLAYLKFWQMATVCAPSAAAPLP